MYVKGYTIAPGEWKILHKCFALIIYPQGSPCVGSMSVERRNVYENVCEVRSFSSLCRQ